MKKLIFNFIKISSILSIIPIANSCTSNKIVFANYESYMSEDVMHNLQSKYNIAFLPYETNEEIENKFSGYYDVAVPSTYEVIKLKKQNQLEKINWDLFNLIVDGKKIKSGKEALQSGVFSEAVCTLIDGLDEEYIKNGSLDNDESILDYGIPYFLQSFAFAYKGSEIKQLSEAKNWSELLSCINSSNKDLDPRFTPYKERKIAIVDDARSMFGLANSINSEEVNPNPSVKSVRDFANIYNDFSSNFAKKYTYFNTDSGQIISTLAKPYPAGASCAIAYNGDLLYAAQGAGLYEASSSTDFHFCKLDKTLIALDMVVINKKTQNNLSKKQKIYEIVKDICLSGVNDGEIISDTNSNGSFKYDSVNNFDYVEYTSPLTKIYDFVMNGDYFSEYTESQIELYRQIFNIDPEEVKDVNYIEQEMQSELAKSNLHWAYMNMKYNM